MPSTFIADFPGGLAASSHGLQFGAANARAPLLNVILRQGVTNQELACTLNFVAHPSGCAALEGDEARQVSHLRFKGRFWTSFSS
jgi:hypothetical protein